MSHYYTTLHDQRPQANQYSYQASLSKDSDNYLPEAQGESQPSLWARLILYYIDFQLRLGVLEL